MNQSVRIRTAIVSPPRDASETIRELTLQALEPSETSWRPELVDVVDLAGEFFVELRGSLADFASAHGCHTVGAHCRRYGGNLIATVVLIRRPDDRLEDAPDRGATKQAHDSASAEDSQRTVTALIKTLASLDSAA